MKEEFENIKYFELIQQYVDGEMDSTEISLFENQLIENEELNKELILYKELIDGIRKFKTDKLLNRFNEIDQELDQIQKIPKIRNINRKIFYAAASIALIIGMTFYFNNSEVRLANKYWEEDRGVPVFMGDDKDEKFNEVMNLYRLQNYDQAAEIITSIRENKVDKDTISYYSGIIEYKRANYVLAVKYFREVLLFRYSVYKEKAEYRLALSYVANREKTKAKQILLMISRSENHLYKEQASNLLKEI